MHRSYDALEQGTRSYEQGACPQMQTLAQKRRASAAARTSMQRTRCQRGAKEAHARQNHLARCTHCHAHRSIWNLFCHRVDRYPPPELVKVTRWSTSRPPFPASGGLGKQQPNPLSATTFRSLRQT